MCGRYWIGSEDASEQLKEIIDTLNRKQEQAVMVKTGEICPTDIAPVIANSRSFKIKPFLMRWGFSGYGTGSRPVINARSETALERPMFHDALLERRCLIPASHYFEWQNQGKSKIKHAIKTIEPMIYMAGIYRFEANSSYPVFTILTKAAADSISHLHDRMPVILPRDICEEWLRPNADVFKIISAADNRVIYGAMS